MKLSRVYGPLHEMFVDDVMDIGEAVARTSDMGLRPTAGCSAVAQGDVFGRNFDWSMGDWAEFVVHVPAGEGRHASVGVSSAVIPMEDMPADAGLLECIPCLVNDGMNDAGFACCLNAVMVPDRGKTGGTALGRPELDMVGVVRFLLDNAGSVDEAISLLNGRSIVCRSQLFGGCECHWLLADPNGTAVVEVIGDRIVVSRDEHILTNFYIHDAGTDPHPHGVERYAILKEGIGSVRDRGSLMDLLGKVVFSKAFDRAVDPFWYSEYYLDYAKDGGIDFTKDSPVEGWAKWMVETVTDMFGSMEPVDRWHTGHCSAYSLGERKLEISVNERPERFLFGLRRVIY